jgi:malate permease and related proteins
MNPTITESLPVISLVVVGFLLKIIGVIRPEDGSLLSRLILKVTLPAVIFLSVSRADVDPLSLALLALFSFLVALILRVLSGRIAAWLKLEPAIAGVIILGSMVMNVGTFIFPVIQTVFGQEGVSRLAAFDVGNSFMASGYGFYIASCFGNKSPCGYGSSLKKVATLPILWALVLGLIVNLTGLTLPNFIIKMLMPISSANTPLAMIALGVFVNFKFPNWKLIGLTVFLRMGMGFLLGQGIVLLFNLQGLDRTIVTLGSAAPIGMVPMVYAVSEGLDTEFAAACISLSIIIGVIITPLLLLV